MIDHYAWIWHDYGNAIALVFVFGLLMGSFLNVCVYRIPLKKSLNGRSFCPHCRTPIPFYRNIPLIPFLWQRGRSACCHKPISWQYPLLELITGFISVFTFVVLILKGVQLKSIFIHYLIWFLLFTCPLIVIAVIDFKLRIIPDLISLPFIVVGLMVNVYFSFPDVLSAIKFSGAGILFGGGLLLVIAETFSRLLKKDAMGGGDIKLVAMLGAFLGLKAVFFIFFTGSLLALVYTAFVAIVRLGKHNPLIPFGPFLSLGAYLYWMCGDEVISTYLQWIKS